MAAGRLDVLLGLDAADFTKGLSKAEYEAKSFQDSMLKLGGQIGTAIGAGAAAAAVALGYMTKSAIDAADHLNDLSKATGLSVENIGGIGFAASQAGADLDGVAASFGKLNLKIAEAARGEKEAAEAFKVIGVAVKDAAGKTRAAEDVFKDVATAFAGFADGPEKAALGMAIFGKSYQSLLPLLADGGQALQDNIDYYKRFGGTTTEVAQQADAFNDTLGKIQLVAGQLGRDLAKELLPPLQVLADEFLKFAESSNIFSAIAKAARVAFETIVILGANVAFVLEGIGREIGAVAAQLVALAHFDMETFDAISKAVKEDGVRARAELDALEKRILQIAAGPSLASKIGTANPDRMLARQEAGTRGAPALGGPDVKKAKEHIDENTQAYARYIEQLDNAADKEVKLTKVQEATLAIEQNRFGTLIPQQKELLLLMAAQADAAEEYAAKIKHNADLEREQNRLLLEREAMIDKRTGRKDDRDALRDLKALDEALASGQITLEEHGKAMKTFWDDTKKDAKETTNVVQEFGLTFASSIGEWIKNPTSGKTFFQALLDDLLQLTTQMLIVAPLAETLKKTFSSGGSGGGGGDFMSFVATLFSSGSGGGGQNLVGVFASGSEYVPSDGLAMVHRGEAIIPASQNKDGSGGRGVNVSITQMFAPGTSRETVNQAAAAASQQIARSNRRNN
jgi:hypothetical protein